VTPCWSTLQTPNQSHLTGYYLDGTLRPADDQPARGSPRSDVGRRGCRPLPEILASQAGLTPRRSGSRSWSMWWTFHRGGYRLVTLEGVQAQLPILQDRVDEGFYNLKARTAEWAGWIFWPLWSKPISRSPRRSTPGL